MHRLFVLCVVLLVSSPVLAGAPNTAPLGDLDGDGIANAFDNCASVTNKDQSDLDRDGNGDACDLDRDGDGVFNIVDNCPVIANPGQSDRNIDGIGDHCQ